MPTYEPTDNCGFPGHARNSKALMEVALLHKPNKIPSWVPTKHKFICSCCAQTYPCQTIRTIEKELIDADL